VEKLPAEDGYEAEFVEALVENREVIVPYFEAETFVESMDKTAAFVMNLIEKNELNKLGDKYVISGGRYTPENGHHYWVRTWDP
jgi:hypothetical protein